MTPCVVTACQDSEMVASFKPDISQPGILAMLEVHSEPVALASFKMVSLMVSRN